MTSFPNSSIDDITSSYQEAHTVNTCEANKMFIHIWGSLQGKSSKSRHKAEYLNLKIVETRRICVTLNRAWSSINEI